MVVSSLEQLFTGEPCRFVHCQITTGLGPLEIDRALHGLGYPWISMDIRGFRWIWGYNLGKSWIELRNGLERANEG